MTTGPEAPAGTNPFSTRFIRPGAAPYWCGNGPTPVELVAVLEGSNGRGQIVGPHGSGKSTLLAALAAPLAAAGRRTFRIDLHGGEHRLPSGWSREAARAGANLIVVDGYEQLGRVSRIALRARCRLHSWGLLVTTHHSVGLPTLLEIAPRLETALAVAEQLQRGAIKRVAPSVVAECFTACGGNVRETLFLLYDRWEALGE